MSQKCQLFLLAVAWVAIASFSAASEPTSAGAKLDTLQKAAQLHRDPGTRAITGVTFRRDQVLDAALVDAVLALPGLEELDISFTRPGTMGYDWIGQIESLERLAMNGFQVTDDDLAFVSKLPNLIRLEARESRLSEAAVRKLAALPSVKELDVSDGLLQEEQLRQIEDAEPRITFTRHWEIELVDDKRRLRMNTPVADFLFEAWAAYPNYRRTYTIQVSGTGKYQNELYAGVKGKATYEVLPDRKKGDYTVTTFFGSEFQLTADGTELVFKGARFDLTGANQTIFVSADDQGEFNQYRVENIHVLPHYVDGECFNSANGPDYLLGEEGEQPESVDLKSEESYDRYRSESAGLGFCSIIGMDFKGAFAFTLCEWPDEVAVLELPPLDRAADRGWPLKPTGRGVTIVYSGIPYSGRTSTEIAKLPVEAPRIGSTNVCLGRSRNFAWRSLLLGAFAKAGIRHTSTRPFAHLELTYQNGVCRIKHTEDYLDLDFIDRGRKLRCTQTHDPNRLVESLRNREIRLLLERDVTPTANRPLYIIDRDGNFRLSDVPQK